MMPFCFHASPKPPGARPHLPAHLTLELLEDRLPPGNLFSAGLAAAGHRAEQPQITRWLNRSVALVCARTDVGGSPSAASADRGARHRQPAAPFDAAPAIELPASDLDSSRDHAPGLRRISDGGVQGRPEAAGATAAPVAAPDAGVPSTVRPAPVGDPPRAPAGVTLPNGSNGSDQPPPPPTGRRFTVSPNVRANSLAICATMPPHGYVKSGTAVAVSGRAVVVVYNDFRGNYCPQDGYQWAGWSYSLDGGRTFTDGGPLPGRQNWGEDPELATGPDGTVYLAGTWNPLTGGLAVLRGTVTGNGITWSGPTVVTTPNEGYDKPNIAVDQATGTIYLTYTRFGVLGAGIGLYVSHDGGLTFQGPTSAVGAGGVQGAVPVVGPNGELDIAYDIGYPSDSGIGFVQSTDGGQTFSPARQIAATIPFTVPGADRAPAFPHLAVDNNPASRFFGNLYVSWQSALHGTGEAVLTVSRDGGRTWTNPHIINTDGGAGIEWFPTVSVDGKGNLDTFFYSRRANPTTRLTDLYFAQSTDGGRTFVPAFAATDVPSNWTFGPVDGGPVYGDYINAVTDGTSAAVAYTDVRDGSPNAYFLRVTPNAHGPGTYPVD